MTLTRQGYHWVTELNLPGRRRQGPTQYLMYRRASGPVLNSRSITET